MAQSDPPAPNLWDFALRIYGLPGVEADFLSAQDDFGLDVPALIFVLYRLRMGIGFDPEAVRALATSATVQITQPLRQVRVALKRPPAYLDSAQAEALRQKVKQAEHESERLTLIALDALPQEPPFPSYEVALFTFAQSRTSLQRQTLEALLKRLAKSAQNM